MPRKKIKGVWFNLARYQRLAAAKGEIHRVFVGSMMDVFEKDMPVIDSGDNHDGMTHHLRDILFNNISNGDYPNLLFLFLTKRPSNINKMIPEQWKDNPPANVMFGTSVVDQKTANMLIWQLLGVNGKKFLSIEPQLDQIDLANVKAPAGYINVLRGVFTYETSEGVGAIGQNQSHIIDWVIQGGESGPKRRPFNLDWAYKLRDQCAAAGVPYFFKQIDKVLPIPEDLMIRQFPSL